MFSKLVLYRIWIIPTSRRPLKSDRNIWMALSPNSLWLPHIRNIMNTLSDVRIFCCKYYIMNYWLIISISIIYAWFYNLWLCCRLWCSNELIQVSITPMLWGFFWRKKVSSLKKVFLSRIHIGYDCLDVSWVSTWDLGLTRWKYHNSESRRKSCDNQPWFPFESLIKKIWFLRNYFFKNIPCERQVTNTR